MQMCWKRKSTPPQHFIILFNTMLYIRTVIHETAQN